MAALRSVRLNQGAEVHDTAVAQIKMKGFTEVKTVPCARTQLYITSMRDINSCPDEDIAVNMENENTNHQKLRIPSLLHEDDESSSDDDDEEANGYEMLAAHIAYADEQMSGKAKESTLDGGGQPTIALEGSVDLSATVGANTDSQVQGSASSDVRKMKIHNMDILRSSVLAKRGALRPLITCAEQRPCINRSMQNINPKKNGGNVMNAASTARGKIHIKLIENRTSRQVTFSKRCNGLMKKAYELSVLCDVQLALITISATGKLFEFASPNMRRVLERYQRCSSSLQNSISPFHDLEYWRHEAMLGKEKLEFMEERQRNLSGENLAGFEVEDLQHLENLLQAGVSRVRARQMQLLTEHIQYLRGREILLSQENAMLKAKQAVAEASSMQLAGSVTTDIDSPGIQ